MVYTNLAQQTCLPSVTVQIHFITIPIVIVMFNTAKGGAGRLRHTAYRITKDRYTLIEQSVVF